MPGNGDFIAAGSFERYIGQVAAAFAVTAGAEHTLEYANRAFRDLITDGQILLGRPIAETFAAREMSRLIALLDRSFQAGCIVRNRQIGPVGDSALLLSCTIWPDIDEDGASKGLVVELRAATQGELTLALQRQVAERLLLGALRELDAAERSEQSRRGAAYLATEGRRLSQSLDEAETARAMAGMTLPHLDSWCILDLLDEQDGMHRISVLHPDPRKQVILDEIEGRWKPALDDGFGLPAALREARPVLVTHDVETVVASTAYDPELSEAVQSLGLGPMLTVPLIVGERLLGAVTFVSAQTGRGFTPEDIELAEGLASRSAMALDRARMYGEAVALRVRAEEASQAKSSFLGMMSHELRTPLNAIGGYVDLLDLGIHGPVTAEQHVDLARIRANQRYLTSLIGDLLNLSSVDSGRLEYRIVAVNVRDMLTECLSMVEPLIAERRLRYGGITCSATLVARADREKVKQILVNLLANAIKFTAPGGGLEIDGELSGDTVAITVGDTGMGVPADKLADIFEPFVQVHTHSLHSEGGVGLGLAISRGLARAMHGDLTLVSTLGEGSRFTLTLPGG